MLPTLKSKAWQHFRLRTSCVALSKTPGSLLSSYMPCWLLLVFSLVLSHNANLQVIHALALSLYKWNHNFHSTLILQFFHLICEATGHSVSRLCPILLHYLSILLLIGEGNGNPLQASLPGKSRGQRNLVGCSPWGRNEWLTLTLCLDWHWTFSRFVVIDGPAVNTFMHICGLLVQEFV